MGDSTGGVIWPETAHKVSYEVYGTGSAALTYRNESGGTEQRTVSLPWEITFTRHSRDFLYLSAQKQGQSGAIEAVISVDGRAIQRAESTSDYGIASVSGSVH